MTLTITLPSSRVSITSGVLFYMLESINRSGELVPSSHFEDSKKLTADGYVYLFEILLVDNVTTIYLKNDNTVTWRGKTYDGTALQLTGVGSSADDETSRPQFGVANPASVYSSLIDQGLLEGGVVSRYKVLKAHLDDDLPIFRRQRWKISRIATLLTDIVTMELRDIMDGQVFQTPARMFIPPDFPTVSLS